MTGLIVVTQTGPQRLSLSDWRALGLTDHTPAGRAVTPVAREQVPALLAGRFGLPGFALGAGGRLVLSPGG